MPAPWPAAQPEQAHFDTKGLLSHDSGPLSLSTDFSLSKSAQTSRFVGFAKDCGPVAGTRCAMTSPWLDISIVSPSSSTIRKTSSICFSNSLVSNVFIAAFYVRIRISLVNHSPLAHTDFSILLCFIANREKILESFFGRLRCAHFYVQMSQYSPFASLRREESLENVLE